MEALMMKSGFWLNDEQWSVIAPLLRRNAAGARRGDGRRVISGTPILRRAKVAVLTG
jgi:transposase